MSAILLITHERVGQALHAAVDSIVQAQAAESKPVVVVLEDDRRQPDEFLHRIQNEIQRLLLDDQLLILTDLPGAA